MTHYTAASAEAVLRAEALTARIRPIVREALQSHEPVEVAGALAYELASVIGSHAPDRLSAETVIDAFVAIMSEQIGRFGVGHEHP